MKSFERVHAELLALAARRLVLENPHDAVQDAMAAAIAAAPHLRDDPDALLTDAQARLELARKELRWQRKRGRSVPLKEAAGSGTGQQPVRRQRKARLPAGLATYRASDVGELAVGTAVGDTADEATRRAAERLAHQDLLRIAAGEPCSARAARLVRELYHELKGVNPDCHWVFLLVEELDRAKRQALSHPEAYFDPTTPSSVTLKRRNRARDRPVERPSVVVETPTTYGRAMRQAYIDEGGQPLLIGTTVGSTEPEFVYSRDRSARADEILCQVRLKLSGETYMPQQIPAFADDLQIVAWLYERLGFDGGGGASAVKTKTLKEWLTKPSLLAKAIEQYVARASERLDDAGANALQQWAEPLVAKIRKSTGANARTGRSVKRPEGKLR